MYDFIHQKNGKKHPKVPPFDIFKGKIKIAHLLPEQSAQQDDHFLKTWPLLSGALDWKIFPFKKSRFRVRENILVQRAAQKWSSLQKMIVSMRWSFWQEMSDFYFSLENDPKGGPLDDIFTLFMLEKPTQHQNMHKTKTLKT